MCLCNQNQGKTFMGDFSSNTTSTGLGRVECNKLDDVGEVRKKLTYLEQEITSLESSQSFLASKLTPILPPASAAEIAPNVTSPSISEVGHRLQALIDRVGLVRHYMDNLSRDLAI